MDEDDIRDPDEQKLERLIGTPDSMYPRQRWNNHHSSGLGNNFMFDSSSRHSLLSRDNELLEGRWSRRRRRRRSNSVEDTARIEYNTYDEDSTPPQDADEMNKAIEESIKEVTEREKQQRDFLEKERIEAENKFLEEQIKQIEEQERLEQEKKLEEERNLKIESIKKKYGIMMGILRRAPDDSIEHQFYELWKNWIDNNFHEKLELNESMKEWLDKNMNQKLKKMLIDDNILSSH